jgi:hypothetical protein
MPLINTILLPLARSIADNPLGPLAISPSVGKHQDVSVDFFNGAVVILILVIAIVVIIVAASFWASDDEERNKRQRNYARVDDLYFPVHAIVITTELLNEIKSHLSSSPAQLEQFLDTFITTDIRMTSLSLGGCAVKSERPLEKGELLVLRMSELPDYPTDQESIVYRVAWVREPKNPDKDARYSAGLQVVEIFGSSKDEYLKKYMGYLLDEPAG